MKVTDKYVLFYGGIFSQWFDCEFQDIEGRGFTTTEQFMMYHKAKLFNDTTAMNWIMQESDPKKIKDMGRKVRNFNEEKWKKVAKKIVTLGNFYKFFQDEILKKEILLYSDKKFVETSPYDRIWGVGLSTTDPKAENSENWEGLNWLGECLTEVCSIINNENHTSITLYEDILYPKDTRIIPKN